MGKCEDCVHCNVCVKLGKPSLYGINKEMGCDKYLEVVRCKDCKYWDEDRRCNGKRNGLVMEYTDEDDFCSYGERKGNEC